MTGMALTEPRLVVVSEGPLAGNRFAVHAGSQLVGHGPDAQVDLDSTNPGGAGLSRRHAWLRWDGTIASIVDAGSTNGTAVNGRRADSVQQLHDGDVIQLGALELRFESPNRPDEPTATHSAYHASNAVSGYVRGDSYQAGRDISNDNSNNVSLDVPEPMDELFQGRGFGRLLMAVGLLVALAGFAGWTYIIFQSGQVNDPNFSPFDDKILGLQAPMVAFGAFAAGGVIISIGIGMSRAARERRRELEWRRRPAPRRYR